MDNPLSAGQRRTVLIDGQPVKILLVRLVPDLRSSWLCKSLLNGSFFFVREADIGELLPSTESDDGV